MLLKIDDNGTLIWQKHYGGDHRDSARTFISTQDGGFLLGGHSLSGISGEVSEEKIGSGDFWIVKTDSKGDQIWDKKYGGSGNDGLFDILQKSNGNHLLFGQSQSGVSGNKTTSNLGGWDYWLVEINPDGEKVDENDSGETLPTMEGLSFLPMIKASFSADVPGVILVTSNLRITVGARTSGLQSLTPMATSLSKYPIRTAMAYLGNNGWRGCFRLLNQCGNWRSYPYIHRLRESG